MKNGRFRGQQSVFKLIVYIQTCVKPNCVSVCLYDICVCGCVREGVCACGCDFHLCVPFSSSCV